MVKRRHFRKARGRRSRRRYSRRGRRASKALRMARSISRKMAGEVKKLDANAIIPEDKFEQLTNALGNTADNATSLPDFGYLYNVFNTSSYSENADQGIDLGDFIGEQVRAKYLYLGVHLQMPVRPPGDSAVTIQQPLCVRVMVVQDRNYSVALDLQQMVQNLFGITVNSESSSAAVYTANADYTLLPINPQEPGRFNVIRDFKMYVAPGYRMDYYKKLMFLQRDLLSGGRFYAGNAIAPATSNPPGQLTSSWSNMRNNIYVLFLYQSPTLYGVAQTGTPDFTISCQTRLAYYDN